MKHNFKIIKKGCWGVYVLLKEQKPVYVGCTKDIKNRLMRHRKEKDFDNYVILKSYSKALNAYNAEQSIIYFLSIFGDDSIMNKKIVSYKDLINYL